MYFSEWKGNLHKSGFKLLRSIYSLLCTDFCVLIVVSRALKTLLNKSPINLVNGIEEILNLD